MARTPHYTDDQIIQALQSTAGVIAAAAEWLLKNHGRSCTRQQISQRILRSQKLTKSLAEILERNLDIAESKLFAAINTGESWAIQFMLKTKGKNRGWSERFEFGGTIQHQHAMIDSADIDEMDMAQLDAFMAERAAGTRTH